MGNNFPRRRYCKTTRRFGHDSHSFATEIHMNQFPDCYCPVAASSTTHILKLCSRTTAVQYDCHACLGTHMEIAAAYSSTTVICINHHIQHGDRSRTQQRYCTALLLPGIKSISQHNRCTITVKVAGSDNPNLRLHRPCIHLKTGFKVYVQ